MEKVTEQFKKSLANLSFEYRVTEPESMDETAEDYAGMDFSKSNAAFVAFMSPLIPDESHTVDFGCGPGDITIALAKARSDLNITGIDIAPTMIAIAELNSMNAGTDRQVSWEVGDITSPIFKEGSIDFAFSHTTLHHLPKLEPFFRQMRAALRSGGGFCIRDLRRPATATEAMEWIYEATEDNLTQRQYELFFYSLRASFTLAEMEKIIRSVGIEGTLEVPKKPQRYWVLSRPAVSAT